MGNAYPAIDGGLSNGELRAEPLQVEIVSGGGGGSTDGLTDEELRAAPVLVSGAFYPVTQPVSGTVAVSNFPSMQPVTDNGGSLTVDGTVGISGTVPVSGPVTDAQLRAAPVPVSGTVAVTGPLTDAQLRAAVVPVSDGNGSLTVDGTFWPATQPVSIAATVAVSGPITDAQIRATALPVSGTFWQATQPVSGPLTDGQLRATAVPVSAPTLTKGAQGANGFATQDLKDSGRTLKCFSGVFTAATTEGMVTLTPVADGAAGGTGTTFGVTSGKRLRLVSLSVSTRNAGAAGQGVVCNLRMVASGSAIVTSPIIASVAAGSALAIANAVGFGSIPLDLELSGTMSLGISQIGTATSGNTVTLVAYEY